MAVGAMGSHVGVSPIGFAQAGAASVSFTTVDSAGNVAKLGERRIVAGEEYVYVQNACAQDASVGYALVQSGPTYVGYALTISSLTGVHDAVCVVKHNTIVAGGYGWGLVRGQTPLALASTMATGVRVTLGDNGVFSTYVVSTGATPPQGMILSSGTGISTTGLGVGYIKCVG